MSRLRASRNFLHHILGPLSVIYRPETSIGFVGDIESRVTSNCGTVGGINGIEKFCCLREGITRKNGCN